VRVTRLVRAVALALVALCALRPERALPPGANRLALEASPYLQQHAYNPVDWYPWGPEAFARARAEGKPVLLSIGYSTCHWCHVMAEESFENPEIAAYLNANYVAIKVDREARPDLDAVYMTAVQAMGVSGGWPLTVWLTPDAKPFYGGTYYPPHTGDRGARIGFLELLRRIRTVYDENPDKVGEAANDVATRVAEAAAPPPATQTPGPAALFLAYRLAAASFDAEHGGFGTAPKFPEPDELRFLLRYARRTGEGHARDMVVQTLDAMARGGIHDQLGGGFHRYGTDAAWRVPHFEKMLYDNALLANAYLDAAQATGRSDFSATARDVLDYLLRDMQASDGSFYAASDADSEGAEGRYFTWTPGEITAALSPDLAPLALAYFDVGAGGQVDGRSVLATPRPLADVAAEHGLDPAEAATRLARIRTALLEARSRRPPPHIDRKVIAAWNALAISAFARAGTVLREPAYTAVAVRAADALARLLGRGNPLAHHALDGQAVGSAFLDDYTFLEAAHLDLFEATGDPRWFESALVLQHAVDARFHDDHGGGYFATAYDEEHVLARTKPGDDGALPSGNSVALENLLRLSAFTGDDAYRVRADRLLAAVGGTLARQPLAATRLLAGLELRLDVPKEIVLVTGRDAPGAAPFVDRLASLYAPNKVVVIVADGEPLSRLAGLVPLVEGKQARDGRTTAYVCEHGVCALPTSDPEVMAGLVARTKPLDAG
jgi:uncharacterized protein YyaL (SSP411 family)